MKIDEVEPMGEICPHNFTSYKLFLRMRPIDFKPAGNVKNCGVDFKGVWFKA